MEGNPEYVFWWPNTGPEKVLSTWAVYDNKNQFNFKRHSFVCLIYNHKGHICEDVVTIVALINCVKFLNMPLQT